MMGMKSTDSSNREKCSGLRIEFLPQERKIWVGEMSRFRIKLTDTVMGKPRNNLDVRIMISLVPGIWQRSDWVQFVAEGVYEIALSVPHEGIYYVFFECPSMGIGYSQLPYLVLQARARGKTRTSAGTSE